MVLRVTRVPVRVADSFAASRRRVAAGGPIRRGPHLIAAPFDRSGAR